MWLAAIAGLASITGVASLSVLAGIAGLGASHTRIAGSSGHTGLGSIARFAFGLADCGGTSSLGWFTDRSTGDLRGLTFDRSRCAGNFHWLAFDRSRCTGYWCRSTSWLAGSSSLGTGVATVAVQSNNFVVIKSLASLGHHTMLVA